MLGTHVFLIYVNGIYKKSRVSDFTDIKLTTTVGILDGCTKGDPDLDKLLGRADKYQTI